jgi:hypothetical protein
MCRIVLKSGRKISHAKRKGYTALCSYTQQQQALADLGLLNEPQGQAFAQLLCARDQLGAERNADVHVEG